MAKEYHSEFLHVIIDCKTGNENLDKSIESTILGYVHLAVYCLGTGKFGQLLEKIGTIAEEFNRQRKNNKE
jgi:hypothetical protein